MVKTNILTIDVEDWYMDTDISMWDSYEDRVVQSTQKILEILDERNTKATFFVVGYVAEHFPELIEDIKDRGHEESFKNFTNNFFTFGKNLD